MSEEIDEVDKWLATQDGKIVKKKEELTCRHRPNERCTQCLPVDPYDENYLKEREIKHMSFHAHLRKLLDANRPGRSGGDSKPLHNVTCSLLPNCPSGHQPYPKGICTKCQPPVLTLNQQRFRHVDNVSIENMELVDRFLNFWRKTGLQRIGFLIGRYEPHLDVPLGIRAVVSAIYEPPQTSGENFVKLEADPNEEKVEGLCCALGLKRVGWIFTDLAAESVSEGTVVHSRSEESFLFSAEECITAGYFQSKYKNYVPNYCTDGYFGSKFVSVVASGDESKHINFHGYQISNQCTAMVEANILCPTSRPELAWVREKPVTETQYIAEVQYKEKNEYGAEVLRNARPMPVEYLLVDVPTGVLKEQKSSFTITEQAKDFPIENREIIPETQNLQSISVYTEHYRYNEFLELASNFHFLLYLLINDTVPFAEEEVHKLARAVAKKSEEESSIWAAENVNWQTMLAMLKAGGNLRTGPSPAAPLPSTSAPACKSTADTGIVCPHCTFVNREGAVDCEICMLPLK